MDRARQIVAFVARTPPKRPPMTLLSAGLYPSLPARQCNSSTRRSIKAYLLNFVFTSAAIAQSVNVGMTHHTWGLEDGLPDLVIQAIAQTPDGYLWLGTPHGLVRFDGFKFVPFANDTAPALREFGVSCILAAKDGTLWIGSVGGGVTHLDSHLDSHRATHVGTDQGFQALTTRALYQSDDGTIWAGTDRGLYKLVGDRFSLVEEVSDEAVTTIVSDASHGFWVAGVNLVHYQQGRLVRVPLPPLTSVIRSLAVAPDGELWIGAHRRLLERRRDGSIQIIHRVDADVRTLCFDSSGRLLIGTIGSGVLLRMRDGAIVRELNPNEPDYRAIRAIVSVRNGDLWIGTHAGLIRLSHTGMDFLKASSSGTSDFGSVFLDRDDSAWLSAGALSRFTAGEEQAVRLTGLKNVQIRAVYREPSGAFWVGTVGNGAYRLVNGRVGAHLLESTAITGFLWASDGSLWIGTDHGLAKWSHGQLTQFPRSGETTATTVKAMALAADGSCWLATPAGLFLFRNGEYSRPTFAQRLAHYRVWSLYIGRNGSLWIGAGAGLYLWQDGALTHIDLPRSLFQSQAVISINVDSQGRFLIAEPAAVFRISGDDLKRSIAASTTVSSDGIREVNLITAPEAFEVGNETGAELYSGIPGVASTDQKGGAWYATNQGLLHIEALPLSQLQIPPPITIETVLVDGAPVSENGPIILPSSTHNVQIQATPILLSGSTGLKLRRRLLGFDDKWSELVPGSSSSYGRLVPGNYTFKVEAYWPGTSAVSFAEVTVIQQSAIYRRPWFISVCCALAALFGWLFYRSRIHHMKLRFQAVVDERSRVAREIHDTLLQGCIGAVSLLEALEISQERARGTIQTGQENRWLMIVQCVREQFGGTIKEAREAIWNLRNADDLKSLDSALREAFDRLTSRKEVETSFRVEGKAVPIIPRVQHEIIMSTREAIMNAVSHARPKSINIRLSFGLSNIIVSISDDGVGFNPSEVQLIESDHFGLSGMRERMRKVRGSMTIESEPGNGTRIYLSFPLDLSRIRIMQ
jgi:ligand-binding sensor domain-containing protein/signal transduction histidine kinase